ncbi:MAG: hypothetical protein ACI4NG_02540, partial [Candidatus Gallimonas sp.]
LENYALPLDATELDGLFNGEAITTATKIDGVVSVLDENYAKVSVTGGYKLYDLVGKKFVNDTVYTAIGKTNPLIVMSKTNGADTVYDYYAPDGTKIAENLPAQAAIAPQSAYVNGKRTNVYTVSYQAANASETERYFTYQAEFSDQKKVWKELQKTDFRLTPYDTTVGATMDMAVSYTAPLLDDYENPLSNYCASMQSYGHNIGISGQIVFYENGAKKSELTLSDAETLGFVGEYLYYYEILPVASSAEKGYNVLEETTTSSGTVVTKYNYTLHRYDVPAGKDKVVKADYLFTDGLGAPLYNRTDKVYDKIYAEEAVPFVDGVAYLSDTVRASRLILNDDLSVFKDLTNTPYNIEAGVIRLKEDRYLVSGYGINNSLMFIIDGDWNKIATFSGEPTVCAKAGLLTFTDNRSYMAVDFDGKIVLEPKYGALNFYGDAAYATVDGDAKIVTVANPDGKEAWEVIGAAETDNVQLTTDGLIFKTVDGSVTVYNYQGAKLLENVSNINTTESNGYVVLTATESGNTVSYLLD